MFAYRSILLFVFVFIFSISALASPKYCSSQGTYECNGRSSDPVADSECSSDGLSIVQYIYSQMSDPNYPWPESTFSANEGWVRSGWEFVDCNGYVSKRSRSAGVNASCRYKKSITNPDYSPSTLYKYYYLNQYHCRDCPIGARWDAASNSCKQKGANNCGRSSSCSNPQVGNPITISTGNKYQEEIDYSTSGIIPLQIVRSYNSELGRWVFNDHPSLSQMTLYDYGYSGSVLKWVREDGKSMIFEKVTSTLYRSKDHPGYKMEISNSNWTLTTPELVRYFYNNYVLEKKVHANGISFNYDHSADNELNVTHSQGGSLSYSYDVYERVKRVVAVNSADIETVFVYTYTGANLSRVDIKSGGVVISSKQYHYEDLDFPRALTGVTDENGIRYATWVYDDQGRAISSEHSNSKEKVLLTYNPNGSTTITNELGRDTTYHFTEINHLPKVTLVEGHISSSCSAASQSYTYFPEGHLNAGQIKTKTDWEGVVTRFEYNGKGQQTKEVEAEGVPEERITLTEWHADFNVPTKITTPTEITEHTYDTNGRLLTTTTTPIAP